MADTYITQTTATNQQYVYSDHWIAQTFTPTSSFRLYTLNFKVDIETATGAVYVFRFYATSGGLPTGSILSTYSKTIAQTSGAEWVETAFPVSQRVVFESGNTYCLVMYTTYEYAPSYDSTSVSYNSAGGLANGQMLTSTNAGSSWTTTSYDIAFQLTGTAPEPNSPSYPTPSDDSTYIPVDILLTWANGSYTDTVDVYLNKSSVSATPVTKVVNNQDVYSYQPPSNLELDEEYVWKVVARNAYGETEGSTWSFTTGSPIEITDVDELQAMNDNKSAAYILMNDIDASETSTWNGGAGFLPIGNTGTPFTGILYGDDFTIDGLTVSRSTTSYMGGLFGVVSTNAYIENVNLTDVSVNGRSYVGGFVGYAGGSSVFYNCTVEGSVTQTGTSAAYNYVGGFVGYISSVGADIDYCSADVTVSSQCSVGNVGGFVGFVGASTGTMDKCYAEGDSTSTGTTAAYVGGFVGYSKGLITDCYATGDTTASLSTGKAAGFVGNQNSETIENCYSTGEPTAKTEKGFCVTKSGTITSCYYDSETSTQSDTGNGTPKTTAQMKQELTFTDWDFDTPIWYIREDTTYPKLEEVVPAKPILPSPEDDQLGVAKDTENIAWEDGGGATSYNVYFGTTSGSLSEIETEVEDTSYEMPVDLTFSTNYYWRIDAVNTAGTTTGDEWFFRTPVSVYYERFPDYDETKFWEYESGEYQWSDTFVAGGGRYAQQLVAIGHNCIYYGSI